MKSCFALFICLIAGVSFLAGEEASKFGIGVAKNIVKKTYETYIEKPAFEAFCKLLIGDPTLITIQQKTLAGVTTAALYVLYKWYTTEKGKDPKNQVDVDIRPKSYKAFLILLLDKDSGVDLIKRFNYELQTIKKDIETGNKQGLELLPLIYPELIALLDATQRQYLNDLIKQVTETDTLVAVPAKSESKPAVS